MFGYGKMSGCAVAAMSSLAENYSAENQLSSLQIADNRNLSQPLVAKVLTVLSQAGLVIGTRGPGGGYRMAKNPKDISIYDVVELFDGHRDTSACPFGPGWCGVGEPCPLHDTLVGLCEATAAELQNNNFAVFAENPKPEPPAKEQ